MLPGTSDERKSASIVEYDASFETNRCRSSIRPFSLQNFQGNDARPKKNYLKENL